MNRRSLLGMGLTALGASSWIASERSASADSPDDPPFLAHWPLLGDARDQSGNGRHGTAHGVSFDVAGPNGTPRSAARFDGRGAHLTIPAELTPRLGRDSFTISFWIHTDAILDNDLGDVVACFDVATRKGFSIGFAHGCVTSSQANWRNLVFGTNNGSAGTWRDRGRPGNSVYTHALTVHEGALYAGTCEPEAGRSGRVYRLEGDDTWVDLGSPDPCNAVASLATHEGRLHAGVSRYRLRGSALPDSPNQTLGGKVYRLEGDNRWTYLGKLGDAEAIGALAVYRGQLHGTSTYSPGVYRHEGGQRWTYCGCGPEKKRVVALGVHNGHLYGSSYDGGFVFRYEGGEKWSVAGTIPNATQTYGFATYQGHLHVSTWPRGEVYRLEDDGNWTNTGRLGEELEVMSMACYNGNFYAGSLPLAQVYRLDPGPRWTPTGRLDMTPDVRYRRAWSMAIHDGQLFCGTLPSGRVHSFSTGSGVSHDRALAPGWRHVAAVRDASGLALFVDGQRVSRGDHAPNGNGALDLDTNAPWLIGKGPQDGFNGTLADIRVHAGALSAAAIAGLADPSTLAAPKLK